MSACSPSRSGGLAGDTADCICCSGAKGPRESQAGAPRVWRGGTARASPSPQARGGRPESHRSAERAQRAVEHGARQRRARRWSASSARSRSSMISRASARRLTSPCRCRATAWPRSWAGSDGAADCRPPSSVTTARSSRVSRPDQWAHDRGLIRHHIDPGKPVQMPSSKASTGDCAMSA
ncbi:MAG: hypothetical protein JWM95_3892 [Gemmatimonadetes bacterium]|nr:hypothetical protein [Gemmatimonadota bacterium]